MLDTHMFILNIDARVYIGTLYNVMHVIHTVHGRDVTIYLPTTTFDYILAYLKVTYSHPVPGNFP